MIVTEILNTELKLLREKEQQNVYTRHSEDFSSILARCSDIPMGRDAGSEVKTGSDRSQEINPGNREVSETGGSKSMLKSEESRESPTDRAALNKYETLKGNGGGQAEDYKAHRIGVSVLPSRYKRTGAAGKSSESVKFKAVVKVSARRFRTASILERLPKKMSVHNHGSKDGRMMVFHKPQRNKTSDYKIVFMKKKRSSVMVRSVGSGKSRALKTTDLFSIPRILNAHSISVGKNSGIEKETTRTIRAGLKSLKRSRGRLWKLRSQSRRLADRSGVTQKEGIELSLNSERRVKSLKAITGAVSRYENNVQIAEVKTHYQIQKYADGNFDEIIKQFTILVHRGGGEARIVLQPEALGSLKLNIKLNNKEINASIIVDNQAVKDLIISKLIVLEESLLQHGFNLGSFQVGVKDRDNDPRLALKEKKKGAGVTGGEVDADEAGSVNRTLNHLVPWISTRVNITV